MTVFDHTSTPTNDAASAWTANYDYSGADREPFSIQVPAGGPFITADGVTLTEGRTVNLVYPTDQVAGAAFDVAEALKVEYVGEVPSPTAGFVENSMVGEFVFSVAQNPLNHLFEMNGQTLTGGVATYGELATQWPGWVSGADIVLPNWRGRALMALGALGITGTSGATFSDATAKNGLRINRTYVQSDWNGQQDSDVSKGSNSNPGRRIDGTPISSSDAYTRPNAVGLILCVRAQGAVRITNGGGTVGQSLLSNGDGSATWTTP